MTLGGRRRARRAVLQALFEMELTKHNSGETLKRLLEENEAPEETRAFAQELTCGVWQNKDKLDAIIYKFAPLFPVEQLAVVDRNILRIALFELLLNQQVSHKVAVNEAVELAKTFGGENSAKFINGVLGSVCRNLTELSKTVEGGDTQWQQSSNG